MGFLAKGENSGERRIDQLDCLMLNDNYERSSAASWKDLKTAVQENVFEVSASIATCEFIKSQLKKWMKPVEAPIPRFLAATGDRMTEDEVQRIHTDVFYEALKSQNYAALEELYSAPVQPFKSSVGPAPLVRD